MEKQRNEMDNSPPVFYNRVICSVQASFYPLL